MRRRALAAAALVVGVLSFGFGQPTVAEGPHELARTADYLEQVIEHDRAELATLRDLPAGLAAALDRLEPHLEAVGDAAADPSCAALVPAVTPALPAADDVRRSMVELDGFPPVDVRFVGPLVTQLLVYGEEILAAC